MSNFSLSNLRGSSRDIGIEPMAFEYDWLMTSAKLKVELVYFFDYAVVVAVIGAGRTNSSACGASVGPTLLVASRAKVIAIRIINGE